MEIHVIQGYGPSRGKYAAIVVVSREVVELVAILMVSCCEVGHAPNGAGLTVYNDSHSSRSGVIIAEEEQSAITVRRC